MIDGSATRSGLFLPDSGDELQLPGTSELGEESNATPAVAGGLLFLRTDRHLVAVGPDA